MLTNKTIISEDNLIFLNKLRMQVPLIRIYRVLVTLLGLVFLAWGALDYAVGYPNNGPGVIMMLCGIIFLVIAFYALNAFSLNRLRKVSHTEIVREYTITNAGIRSDSVVPGAKAVTDYSYDAFGKCFQRGSYIYLEIKFNKMYLLVDTNGFPNPSDDRKAFLDCLERNGIVPVKR